MKLNEAYTILGVSSTATPEEAKKQYRKLTKEFHPDINKSPEAEEKFKKINEAYQCVQNGKGSDREPTLQNGNPWGSHATKQQVIQLENIEVHATISFKESVLGCKKDIKYTRQSKCQDCSGAGEIRLNNGCKKCGGKGQIIIKQGQTIMVSTCVDCFGRSKTESCKVCSGQGTLHTDVSVHVSIPAGIIDNATLRLQGMGNYAGSFMGFTDQYTDAFCHVTVTPEVGLNVDGANVISHLIIPLIDALRGCTHVVKTIHGEKEIQVKPQSRNRDEVIIPHCGVSGTGDQKVVLDVQYPKNTDKLIGILLDEVI